MKASYCKFSVVATVASLTLSSCSEQKLQATTSTPLPLLVESPSPLLDTFKAGLAKADDASHATQTAETKEDWDLATARWQRAIELMQKVPKESADYLQAQKALADYRSSLAAAQKHVKRSTITVTPAVEAQKTPNKTIITEIDTSRTAIQQLYEDQLGFVFEEASDAQGQPRVIGHAPNGLTSLEIIGHPSALSSVSLMVGVPERVPKAVTKVNALLMLILLKHTCPNWNESANWLSQSMREVASSDGKRVETSYRGKQISVQRVKPTGQVILAIKTTT